MADTGAAPLRPLTIGVAVVAFVAAGAALKALAGIIVPLVLAVFLLLLVDAVARALHHGYPRLPRWTGIAAGLVTVAAAVVGSIWIVAAQAAAATAQAAMIAERVEQLLDELARRFGVTPVRLDSLLDNRAIGHLAEQMFQSLQGFAGGAPLVAIYLGFLIAKRRAARDKFARLFVSEPARSNAKRVAETVRRAVEQYVWVQTVTGLLIALLSWALMALLGVGNALLLALIVFLTSYLPVIGPALGVFVPTPFALAQLGDWRTPLLLLAMLQALNFVVNNLMVPRLQADRLNLDPTVVLLGLGLWTYVWGLPGALLSPPLTVLNMAVAAEFSGARWIAVLLSRDGALGTGKRT